MNRPLKEYLIQSVDDVVTNVDAREVGPNYALKMRGANNYSAGMICQRDFGTIRSHASYPAGVTIRGHIILNDPVTGTEHDIIFGTDGSANSVIYVYDSSWTQITAASDIFNIANGSTPHIRWSVEEVLRKVNLYYGTSAVPSVLRNPVEIKKWNATKYFYSATDTAFVSQAAGWRMEKGGGGLIPTSKEQGTPSAPLAYDAEVLKTGTVTTNGTDSTVNGSGTAFLTDYKPGQYIALDSVANGFVFRVVSVTSNTLLTVEGTPPALSDVTHQTHIGIDTEIADTVTNFLRLRLFRIFEVGAAGVITKIYKTQLIVTTMYDGGTKESDPIYRAYIGNTVGNIYDHGFARATLACSVKSSAMNKRISGLRFYEERSEQLAAGNYSAWDTAGTETRLIYELKFNEYQSDAVWAANTEDPSNYDYRVILPEFTYSYVDGKLKAAVPSLVKNIETAVAGSLTHAVDPNRSYLSPRFAVKAARTQGAIVAADQDDRTVRLSTYNGDNIHEEDNFPDVTADVRGFIQKIALNGRGTVVGYRVMDDVLYVFRETELETWDLQSLQLGIRTEGCISGVGIVQSKYGISYPSQSGIRHIPRGGGGAYLLNPLWQNLYDGSMFIDDRSAQYVTDAYRKAILGGFYELGDEAWFAMQMNIDTADGGGSEYVCAVYSYIKKLWRFRKLHIGSGLTVGAGQEKPVSFTSRKDGSLAIAYASAILKYPNRSGTRMFEDDVNSDGSTNSKGIETDIMFNITGLANAIPHAVVKGIKVLHKGSTVDKGGLATMRLYANNELYPFDTKYFRIDDPPQFRSIDRRGLLEALKVRLSLPAASITNFKDFDVSQVILGYDAVSIQGNR